MRRLVAADTVELTTIINMSAFRATRPAFSALRQIARPAYTTAARQSAARPVSRTVQLQGLRFKTDNLARSAFAKNPIITYDELKPITEQPSDVCFVTVDAPLRA